MKCACVSVPKEEAERIIKDAIRNDRVRKDLQIRQEGEYVIIPMKEGADGFYPDAFTSEFEFRKTEHANLNTVEAILGQRINVGWERLGRAIIFNQNFPGIEEIAKKIVSMAIADQVYVNEKRIISESRKPMIKLLSGVSGDVIIRENGVRYVMDPSKLMFSKGNVTERGIKHLKNNRYRDILDMFAGIGYFTLPLAVRESVRQITAIDINETALMFLARAGELNNVQSKIHVKHSDCRIFNADILFDLVIMGNFKSLEYMVHGLRNVKDGGDIVFHHLEESSNIRVSVEHTMQRGKRMGYNLSMRNSHIVKSYSPHLWHLSSTFIVHRR